MAGVVGRPLPTMSEATTTTTTARTASTHSSPERRRSCINCLDVDPTTLDCESYISPPPLVAPPHPKRKTTGSDTKRERKAARTLAIITGAFVFCWLPFFIIAIILPIYGSDKFPSYVVTLSMWLGYFNSTLNPIIYTIFSPEFRHVFKRYVYGQYYSRRVNRQNAVRHVY